MHGLVERFITGSGQGMRASQSHRHRGQMTGFGQSRLGLLQPGCNRGFGHAFPNGLACRRAAGDLRKHHAKDNEAHHQSDDEKGHRAFPFQTDEDLRHADEHHQHQRSGYDELDLRPLAAAEDQTRGLEIPPQLLRQRGEQLAKAAKILRQGLQHSLLHRVQA